MPGTIDVAALRHATPGCAHRTHLNNAGAALMPEPVLRALHEHLELEATIGGYEAAAMRTEAVAATYDAIGALIGAPARNVALVENATVAVAQALSSVDFARGDVILTTRNDYASSQIMFLSLSRRLGVEVVHAPDLPGGGVDLEAFASLVRRHRPRVVAVTEVPTSSGLVQPVAAIGALCRREGVPVYLVDACQSVGQMPVDALAIGCDFLAATCRKFLRGPRGLGFLYVGDRMLASDAMPLFPDLHSASWDGPDTFGLAAGAKRFENWEFSQALVLGAGAAARYALDTGLDAIEARVSGLAAYARERLATLDGVAVRDRGARLSAIVTASIAGERGGRAWQRALYARGINTSVTTAASARFDFVDKGIDWALRVSPHAYNTRAEIDALIDAIDEIRRTGD